MQLTTVVFAILLALSWLIPNHFLPWPGFHGDAWMAIVGLCLASWGLMKRQAHYSLANATVFLIAIALIPWAQYLFGIISIAGVAWMGFLYVFGAAIALNCAFSLEKYRQHTMADLLFISVAIASLFSVGIQLCQWFSVIHPCFCSAEWIYVAASPRRAAANLAQPNHTASLLVWGVCAFYWAFERGRIGLKVAAVAICFLVLGIALTESRTGALALGLVWGMLCYWHNLWRSRWVVAVATLMLFAYAIFAMGLSSFDITGQTNLIGDAIGRTKTESRLQVWEMFLRALASHPLAGYGWDQSILAHVGADESVWQNAQLSTVVFGQAHNLFLDLLLWVGVPVGLPIVALVLRWNWLALSKAKTNYQALTVLPILTIGVHAMLELPLHYAYFLIPTAMFAGVVEARQNPQKISLLRFASGRLSMYVFIVSAALLLALVISDYFKAEESYTELRLENNRVRSLVPRTAPEVVLLTQLRDVIVLERMRMGDGWSSAQIKWVVDIGSAYPSPMNMLKIAQVHALNQRPEIAVRWLKRLCEMHPKEQCSAARTWWGDAQRTWPALMTTQYPI